MTSTASSPRPKPATSRRESSNIVDTLLRASEVAGMLRISVRSVWRLRASGTLPCVTIPGVQGGRFKLSEVKKLVDEHHSAVKVGSAAAALRENGT